MLKIRLQRIGRKHEPVFRLVLTDSKNSTKSGKFLEILGNYDARHGEKAVMNTEKVTYWMSKGAQVSDTVHNMLVSSKVIAGKKINTLPLKKATPTQKVGESTESVGFVKEVPVEKVAPVAAAPTPVVETSAPASAPVVEEVVPVETPVEVVAEVTAPEVVEAPAEEIVA